jgi:hypothetical protein
MNQDTIWSILLVTSVMIYGSVKRLRKTKRIFIPDYERGLRFVKGSFVSVLGPGSYHPFSLKEHIEVVDMRPQPIFLERIPYRDAWQAESWMSIAAELFVSDAHLAATTLKDRVNDSVVVVRDSVRSVVSRVIGERSPEFFTKTATDIGTAVNDELARVGMRLSNIEIVEFWSRPRPRRTAEISN